MWGTYFHTRHASKPKAMTLEWCQGSSYLSTQINSASTTLTNVPLGLLRGDAIHQNLIAHNHKPFCCRLHPTPTPQTLAFTHLNTNSPGNFFSSCCCSSSNTGSSGNLWSTDTELVTDTPLPERTLLPVKRSYKFKICTCVQSCSDEFLPKN